MFINTFLNNDCITEIYYNSIYINNKKLYAYGWNECGMFGVGINNEECCVYHKLILINKKVIDIFNNGFLTIFITSDKKLYAAGSNYLGQLGVDIREDVIYTPELVKINDEVIKIIYVHNAIFYITNKGETFVSGNNKYGSLGIGNFNKYIYKPEKMAVNISIKKIISIDYSYYFITNNNKLYASGLNLVGCLGVGYRDKCINVPLLVDIPGEIEKVIELKAYNHIYIITKDKKYYLSGNNEHHHIGVKNTSSILYKPELINIDKEFYENINYCYDLMLFFRGN